MKLNERLIALRKMKGLTQEELANHLLIKRARYNAWEMGVANPDYYMLAALAKFYSVSVDFLLGISHKSDTPLLSDDEYADGYTDESVLKDLEKKLEEQLNPNKQAINTIAAHLEGKNITPQKLKLLEQYIKTLFSED